MAVKSYIALGSNLDSPLQQLQQALQQLDRHPDIELLCHSSWYKNPPLDGSEQPDYINGVAALTTTLSAPALLASLQAIEDQQGRQRSAQRWAARTLDLDILLYARMCIDTPTLQVPHPRLCERAFVVFPLLEIAPELTLPYGTALQDIAAGLSAAALEKVQVSG